MLHRSHANNFHIRSIWVADITNQGASGVLNEALIGNDPSWQDHARDLLHMINHFRAEMPRPLIGIGHSMGGVQLVNLALMHPRLLTTVVLMDPVLMSLETVQFVPSVAPQMSTVRRDMWPSRAEAEASFRKSEFFQRWDSRVLDLYLKYGLRELPTAVYPKLPLPLGRSMPVTLTTTKHQEVFSFARPIPGLSPLGTSAPDIDPEFLKMAQDPARGLPPWYRPEFMSTHNNLPFVRPSVLYVLGGKSEMSPPAVQAKRIEVTGTGVGGNGGASKGRVKTEVVKDAGHLVPMDEATQCAYLIANWVGKEMVRWREEERKEREAWAAVKEKSTFGEEWKQMMRWKPKVSTAAKL